MPYTKAGAGLLLPDFQTGQALSVTPVSWTLVLPLRFDPLVGCSSGKCKGSDCSRKCLSFEGETSSLHSSPSILLGWGGQEGWQCWGRVFSAFHSFQQLQLLSPPLKKLTLHPPRPPQAESWSECQVNKWEDCTGAVCDNTWMVGQPLPPLSSPAGAFLYFCCVPESRTRTELLQKASREKSVLTIPAIYIAGASNKCSGSDICWGWAWWLSMEYLAGSWAKECVAFLAVDRGWRLSLP